MSLFHLTIVSATTKEIQPIIDYLDKNTERIDVNNFQTGELKVDILITGIGILETTYSLMDYLSHSLPDRWIQAGIGGAYDPALEIGNTYQIKSEILLDFGAQDKDGGILSPFDLGWLNQDQFPFSDGIFKCPHLSDPLNIPVATGMTSMYAHGNEEKIKKISDQPHGQIESMEGASFFYVSLMKKIPFISFRAVSNYVQPRDKSTWKIDVAIASLAATVIQFIQDPRL